jgi:hypothetical protein
MLLMTAALAFGQTGSPSRLAANSTDASTCELGALPSDIQTRLKSDFGSWKIQQLADLSQRARERWKSEVPSQCPGIAIGYFESAKTLSYAILLVPAGHADVGYRLVVLSQKAGHRAYETTVVGKLDQNGAANYFIHTTPISKFFDEPSRNKFQARGVDGILLVDSAENEYGVEVYFWSGGRYRHEPIDY